MVSSLCRQNPTLEGLFLLRPLYERKKFVLGCKMKKKKKKKKQVYLIWRYELQRLTCVWMKIEFRNVEKQTKNRCSSERIDG